MISLAEARSLICAHVSPRPAEVRPLAAACGCILAEDIQADADYPTGDRAMMDGYALPLDAQPGVFSVVGEIQTATLPTTALRPGEAVRIFTGGLLPPGGGRVIMQEDVQRCGDQIRISQLSDRLHVRSRGAEARTGQSVLPAGMRLGPAELAILAQVGVTQPQVIRPPNIRHVATGAELVDPAAVPEAGQIRDTNSSLLQALFAEAGPCEFKTDRCTDDLDTLVALGKDDADLFLISGGAGAGDYDFGATSLRKLGFSIHFDRVNLRPGKPLTFATRGHSAAFVIPGNPVSHFVCFHLALRCAAERMLGLAGHLHFVRLPVTHTEILRPDSRESFWPAKVAAMAGQLTATPLRWSTSGDTFSLAGANALLRLPPNESPAATADVLLLAPQLFY